MRIIDLPDDFSSFSQDSSDIVPHVMTMAIFREDGIEEIDLLLPQTSPSQIDARYAETTAAPLVKAKLEMPETSAFIERKVLSGLVERWSKDTAATLIVGRAGTGKTGFAARYAARKSNAAWYSIDSGDAEWNGFIRYFQAAVTGRSSDKGGSPPRNRSSNYETPFKFFADIGTRGRKWPSTLVLDNIHKLYDCEWFNEFFTLLITSVPHDSHLLMLSRSKPPGPVWRLRSKQALNVIDEKLLLFSQDEVRQLFKLNGLDRNAAAAAYKRSLGRAAELERIIAPAKDKTIV